MSFIFCTSRDNVVGELGEDGDGGDVPGLHVGELGEDGDGGDVPCLHAE